VTFHGKQTIYDASKRVLSARERREFKLKIANARRLIAPQLRPLPDFLVIGTMRGGTSSLYKYLESHPGTAASLRKEVRYFSDFYGDRDLNWYRAHFPFTMNRLAFEASPDYLWHPDVPKRVADTLPGVRLVVLLREPLTRARSEHTHWAARQSEVRTFDDAVRDEAARGLNPGYLARGDYLSRSLYGAQLQRWLEHHSPDMIGVFDSDRLFSNTAACLADIARFLGLDPAGFKSTNRNYSREREGGVPATQTTAVRSLPSEARDALATDRVLLGEILSRLPVAATPRWVAELL
jgi:hypothetical protein